MHDAGAVQKMTFSDRYGPIDVAASDQVSGGMNDGVCIASTPHASQQRQGPAHDEAILDRLLLTAGGRAELTKLAEEMHSEELVQFFALYMELKNSKLAAERLKIASKMTSDFLISGSKHELNLEHTTRMTMERLHARLMRPGLEADVSPSVFDCVRDEVRSMVTLNLLPLYKQRQTGEAKTSEQLISPRSPRGATPKTGAPRSRSRSPRGK
jgi:hypothetical protein